MLGKNSYISGFNFKEKAIREELKKTDENPENLTAKRKNSSTYKVYATMKGGNREI